MKRFCILFLIFFFSCSNLDEDIPFSYSVDILNVEIGYPVSLDINVNNAKSTIILLIIYPTNTKFS